MLNIMYLCQLDRTLHTKLTLEGCSLKVKATDQAAVFDEFEVRTC